MGDAAVEEEPFEFAVGGGDIGGINGARRSPDGIGGGGAMPVERSIVAMKFVDGEVKIGPSQRAGGGGAEGWNGVGGDAGDGGDGLRIEFGKNAAGKGSTDGEVLQSVRARAGVEIEDRCFKAHGDIQVATRETFKRAVGHFTRGIDDNAGVVDEGRDGFVICIDAAKGLAVLVLQRGEGAPLVDDEGGGCGGGEGEEEKRETQDASIRCQPMSAGPS